MPAPYNIPGSKLDRAIVAYLISLNGAYTASNTFPANYFGIQNYPCVVVNSRRWTPDPVNAGCNEFQVKIEFHFSSVQKVGDKTQSARLANDKFIGNAIDALMLGDDGQTFAATCGLINTAGRALATLDATYNGDMGDFTLKRWNDDGGERGAPEEEGAAWVEIFNFKASVASFNVD